MRPNVRDLHSRGRAGAPGAQLRTLTRRILERVRMKKRLAVIGLLVVMISGAVPGGAFQ